MHLHESNVEPISVGIMSFRGSRYRPNADTGGRDLYGRVSNPPAPRSRNIVPSGVDMCAC